MLLNKDGTSSQLQSTILNDMSKKAKLNETIMRHRKESLLKNYRRRRNVTICVSGGNKRAQSQPFNQLFSSNFNEKQKKTQLEKTQQRRISSKMLADPVGPQLDFDFDEDEEDPELDKKYQEIQLEQFIHDKVKSVAS